MINIIRIAVKFDFEPSRIFLDMYSNSLIIAVDDYCNNRQRSFITEEPSKEQKDKGDFVYRWEIEVDDCSIHTKELFDYVNPIPGGKVLLVDVRDKKYDPKYNNCNVGYYWTNEGTTWYHDSEKGYKDAIWEFHVNGHSDYRIVHIPTQIDKLMDERSKSFYRNSGATYMWSCVSSWDNWMKATIRIYMDYDMTTWLWETCWRTYDYKDNIVEGIFECGSSTDYGVASQEAFTSYTAMVVMEK